MNPWRWVDPRVDQVRVVQIHAYLEGKGWKPQDDRPHGRVFEKATKGKGSSLTQLVPSSERLSDYRQSVVYLITTLSEVEDRHPVEVLEEMLGQTAEETPNGQADVTGAKSARGRRD